MLFQTIICDPNKPALVTHHSRLFRPPYAAFTTFKSSGGDTPSATESMTFCLQGHGRVWAMTTTSSMCLPVLVRAQVGRDATAVLYHVLSRCSDLRACFENEQMLSGSTSNWVERAKRAPNRGHPHHGGKSSGVKQLIQGWRRITFPPAIRSTFGNASTMLFLGSPTHDWIHCSRSAHDPMKPIELHSQVLTQVILGRWCTGPAFVLRSNHEWRLPWACLVA